MATSAEPTGWIIVEESSFGSRAFDGVYDDLAAVLHDRDDMQRSADMSDIPVQFVAFALTEVEG